MSTPSLDRLLHRATKFPDPTQRLNSLHVAFEATEAAIAHQADQLRLRTKASLKRAGMHPDDIEYELYVMRTTTEELFPQVFRSGFLVSVWAVFESGIKDLAEYVKRGLKQPFGLQDLRSSDFLEQSDKFFNATLGVRVFPDKALRTEVQLFKDFRNTIVHHNGSLEHLPKNLASQRDLYQTFKDLHHTFAVPSAAYNKACITLSSRISNQLAEAIYERLHPIPPSDA